MKVYEVVEKVVEHNKKQKNSLRLYRSKKKAFSKAQRLTAKQHNADVYREISYYVVMRKLNI